MKKAFNIVAGVCTIVLMAVLIIGAGILLYGLSELSKNDYSVGSAVAITVIILIFSIATVIIGGMAIATGKPGLKIAIIALVGVLAVLEFVGNNLLYGFLCLIPIGFEIASLAVKDAPSGGQAAAKPDNTQTTDDKIAELKHLKELGAITEEQYNAAISSIINKLK